MKTKICCVTAVALLVVTCCLGSRGASRLPGTDVGNGDLAKVWAATTNPGPQGGGGCIYKTPNINCKTHASGDECGNQEFIKPGNVTCSAAPTSTKYICITDTDNICTEIYFMFH